MEREGRQVEMACPLWPLGTLDASLLARAATEAGAEAAHQAAAWYAARLLQRATAVNRHWSGCDPASASGASPVVSTNGRSEVAGVV